MRRLLLLFSCLACATAPRQPREVRPDALKGVSILLPAPSDERRTQGVGCGFVAQDLAVRANKALVQAFSDTGATLRAQGAADYTLTVVLRDAVMGPEQESHRRTDKPVINTQPDAPPLDQPQASPFDRTLGRAEVVLEGTLTRGGDVLWRGTVTGSARSAPCVQTMEKVREALQDAVESLREDVLRAVRAP